MKPNPMMEALRQKKARGLDVTILLGGGHEGQEEPLEDADQERKELGLAPDATPLGHDQDERDVAQGQAGHHENMMPGEEIENHPDAAEDKALIENVLASSHLGKNSVHRKTHAKGMMKKGAGSHPLSHDKA